MENQIRKKNFVFRKILSNITKTYFVIRKLKFSILFEIKDKNWIGVFRILNEPLETDFFYLSFCQICGIYNTFSSALSYVESDLKN